MPAHAGSSLLPSLQLARQLLGSVGAGWASRVFYTDNGSTAIEVTLHMLCPSARRQPLSCCQQDSTHGGAFPRAVALLAHALALCTRCAGRAAGLSCAAWAMPRLQVALKMAFRKYMADHGLMDSAAELQVELPPGGCVKMGSKRRLEFGR